MHRSSKYQIHSWRKILKRGEMPLVLFRSQASAFCGKTVIAPVLSGSGYRGSSPRFHIRPENIYKGAEKHLLYDFSNADQISPKPSYLTRLFVLLFWVIYMDKKEELKAIMEHPEYMLIAENKTLKQRINSKKIGKEDVKKAVAVTAKNKGKSLVSDVLNGKWFDLVYDFVNTGEQLRDKLDDAKKMRLIGECLQKSDNHEKMLNSLVDLITNPYGLTLYLKIVNLLSEAPVDGDTLDILSDYLSNLAKEDNLEKAFSRNKTILNLIDKCSPQALILLRRADEWPLVKGVKVLEINNGYVQGDNSRPIAKSFVEAKQFSSIPVDDMQMAIIDLDTNGLAKLVYGTMMSNPSRKITVEQLTDLGRIVREAITRK